HVPPYDDLRIIAGQGTVGLELVEQLPGVDVVLVPVSGGGLISGIATAVKSLRPQATVLGVEPELAADAQQSLRSGEHTAWDPDDTYRTLADGLRTPALGAHPWQHVRRNVDDIITVSEDGIRSAVRHLAVAGRLVAEPSGAVTTAAWLERDLPSGRTAAIVSGGASDPDLPPPLLRPGGSACRPPHLPWRRPRGARPRAPRTQPRISLLGTVLPMQGAAVFRTGAGC